MIDFDRKSRELQLWALGVGAMRVYRRRDLNGDFGKHDVWFVYWHPGLYVVLGVLMLCWVVSHIPSPSSFAEAFWEPVVSLVKAGGELLLGLVALGLLPLYAVATAIQATYRALRDDMQTRYKREGAPLSIEEGLVICKEAMHAES